MIPGAYRKAVWDLVEAAGNATQSVGLGRVVGQIYACLYLSRDAATLDDLVQTLRISKGSACMAVRRLAKWGAVEKTAVDGDRKDYYRACDRFGSIVKHIVRDVVGEHIDVASSLLHDAEERMNAREAGAGSESRAFARERIKVIRNFERRIRSVWDHVFVGILLR